MKVESFEYSSVIGVQVFSSLPSRYSIVNNSYSYIPTYEYQRNQ